MSTELSRMAGCSMAMGLLEDAKTLIAEMTPAAIAKSRVTYAGTGLTEAATRWLAVGERGASSDAMFLAMTGIEPIDMQGGPLAYPHDPDDLRRCRLLVEQMPELAAMLEEIAAISPVWARIAAAWETLCSTMDTESPNWRNGGGKGTRTHELLTGLGNASLVSTASEQSGSGMGQRRSRPV